VTEAPNLAPDAFRGTAEAYLRGRPPYPRALLQPLVAAAAPTQPSALLDLACGPGRVALDLAAEFDRVLAIDLELEMIEVGRREAARRGVDNVRWFVGRAEDAEASATSFDLITVGEAFHRLDQALIVAKAREWLKPGGCLATLGADGVLGGEAPWQHAAATIAHRWMRRAFPNGWAQARSGAATRPDEIERVFEAAGFVDVASRRVREEQVWTVDAVVSHFRSMSVCSDRALGDDAAAFEGELRSVLTPLAGGGELREEARFGFTIGRRPPE